MWRPLPFVLQLLPDLLTFLPHRQVLQSAWALAWNSGSSVLTTTSLCRAAQVLACKGPCMDYALLVSCHHAPTAPHVSTQHGRLPPLHRAQAAATMAQHALLAARLSVLITLQLQSVNTKSARGKLLSAMTLLSQHVAAHRSINLEML